MCLGRLCWSWELRTGVIFTGAFWSIFYLQNVATYTHMYFFIDSIYNTTRTEIETCTKFTNLLFYTAIALTSIILIIAGMKDSPPLSWPWLITIKMYMLWLVYPLSRWWIYMMTWKEHWFAGGGQTVMEIVATVYFYFIVLNYALRGFYWH